MPLSKDGRVSMCDFLLFLWRSRSVDSFLEFEIFFSSDDDFLQISFASNRIVLT